MNFEELLKKARSGEQESQEAIFIMYRPLLMKNSIIDGGQFNEDLYQELSQTLLNCIYGFKG